MSNKTGFNIYELRREIESCPKLSEWATALRKVNEEFSSVKELMYSEYGDGELVPAHISTLYDLLEKKVQLEYVILRAALGQEFDVWYHSSI